MAPMITDSYLKYNSSEFGSKNQSYNLKSSSELGNNTKYYSKSSKPPLPSMPSYPNESKYNNVNNSNSNTSSTIGYNESSLNNFSLLESNRRRFAPEETVLDILKGNHYRLQIDLFEDLITRVQYGNDNSLNIRHLDSFYEALGSLVINTINTDVQHICLRFIQVYLKQVEKQKRLNHENFDEIDAYLNTHLVPYLIAGSCSQQLKLKQVSIDLIYTYMRITNDRNSLFYKFIQCGIESADYQSSKTFMDHALNIVLTEEFKHEDYTQLIKALVKQLPNPIFEASALKCLNKIEKILNENDYDAFIDKLTPNLQAIYYEFMKKNKLNEKQQFFENDSSINSSDQHSSNLRFNLVPELIIQKLSGEDETQRLQAIKQLEQIVKSIKEIKVIYPYYQDFIAYVNNFVDDLNYEIRLGSLKILTVFIEKLGANVNQCYKVICSCAKQVMSQTHQSKPIKQLLVNVLMVTIENMFNPILVLEALLEKIKDRSAKAREEFLNIITAAVLKYSNDKFDSLRKVFNQVVPLLCDIKRNVRHAALECIAVIYSKLKLTERNIGVLLDQLDQAPECHNIDNLPVIKEVIMFRVNRNQLPTLNSNLTIEYAVKIPNMIMPSNYGNDLDIEWIVSATSSSASVSNLSSARSQKSVFSEISNNTNNMHRVVSMTEGSGPISSGSFKQRRTSATKRLPWDDFAENNQTAQNGQLVPKVMKSREVAPLKAFPLVDDNATDSKNQTNNAYASNKQIYPAPSSYQEKYLKKIQMTDQPQNRFQNSKTDSQIDLNDIPDTARKMQNEKAFSLDNLYNLDDSINSENNIQKRKYANLNLKNGVIPSKPIIPRRNSANLHNDPGTNRTNSTLDAYDEIPFSDEIRTDRTISSEQKFETMPNIRLSAKNRKKLDKLFGTENASSNGNNDESNLYLSKLRAEKNNDNASSRYTPSNPESGIFSLSDYDNNDNTTRLYQANSNSNVAKKPPLNHRASPDSYQSDNLSLDVVSPFNSKPKLIRSNSKTKIDLQQQQQQIFKQQSNNNSNQLKQQQQQQQTVPTNNLEYNPSAGVSFKATHASDVEIVGVKLGNNSSPPETTYNLNAKKKASLQGLNDLSKQMNLNGLGDNEEILDIVGKGYNYNTTTQQQQQQNPDPSMLEFYLETPPKSNKILMDNNSDYGSVNTEEVDYPLSLSFQSRLRQKTQEKIEEKQKRKVEKIKKARQQKELESLNTALMNYSGADQISPSLMKDFGLSISGYQNNSQTNGKSPLYVNNPAEPQVFSYDDIPIKTKQTSDYNLELELNEYPEDFAQPSYNNNSNNNNNVSNELPAIEKPKFKPTPATQARLRAKAAAAQAQAQPQTSPTVGNIGAVTGSEPPAPKKPETNSAKKLNTDSELGENGVCGMVKEEFTRQPFKNAEAAFKDAMSLLAQEDWEKKCQAMNLIRRLSLYHEDVTVNNMHSIVLALIQEVKNLRSQVSRFSLLTFGDLFSNLKRNMDVDLDIVVKAILAKNAESTDFIRSDIDKCLDKMFNNVTTHKALIALINGGASHRSPTVRKTTAQFVFKCCEIMGPGKILSGIKDVTEKVLVTASQFVIDGPPDIRWFGRRMFHMLMSHDEFDRLLVKCLNENTRKNIKEILDTIRVKGPGDIPTDSARVARKNIRSNTDPISKSAGNNATNMSEKSERNFEQPSFNLSSKTHSNMAPITRIDPQYQEHVNQLCGQLRNADFKERIDAIEKFQIMCETQTEVLIVNMLKLFDKFNQCLTDSNSKVNYKALSTMFQITPILGDNLSAVISNVVPLVAQNLASKNSEIQDMASEILNLFVEYLDGGILIQPFSNIAQHGNARIRPEIVNKLAELIPLVYTKKQKQVELHVLPTLWSLLNSVKGSVSATSAGSLNGAIQKLANSLYQQMGEHLTERAANSSNVSKRNFEILRELLNTPY